MVKLQKLKAALTPAGAEASVSNEAWAEAAGETVETLARALEEGENAKEELGEPAKYLLLKHMYSTEKREPWI